MVDLGIVAKTTPEQEPVNSEMPIRNPSALHLKIETPWRLRDHEKLKTPDHPSRPTPSDNSRARPRHSPAEHKKSRFVPHRFTGPYTAINVPEATATERGASPLDVGEHHTPAPRRRQTAQVLARPLRALPPTNEKTSAQHSEGKAHLLESQTLLAATRAPAAQQVAAKDHSGARAHSPTRVLPSPPSSSPRRLLRDSAPGVARDREKARGDVVGVLDLWAG